ETVIEVEGEGAAFCLSGEGFTIDADYLKSHPGYKYQGTAKEVYFKTVSEGQVLVNNEKMELHHGNVYLFKGNLTIHLYKDHNNGRINRNGKWHICVKSDRRPL